jgi:hypothetical protein
MSASARHRFEPRADGAERGSVGDGRRSRPIGFVVEQALTEIGVCADEQFDEGVAETLVKISDTRSRSRAISL